MTKSLVVRCSPLGKRSGLAVARANGHELTLIVLPKVWRPTKDKVRRTVTLDTSKAGTTVVAYELDDLVFEDPAMGPLVELLLEKDARQRDSKSTADREALLLERNYGNVREFEDTKTDEPDAALSVLALALLEEKLGPNSAPPLVGHASNDASAGLAPSEAAAASEIKKLVRAWELVTFVERRMQQVRQGYEEQIEKLARPRGKLLARGIALHLATEDPRLLCVFDEFTHGVPLFRLIVTALEAVAAGRGAGGVLASSSFAKGLRARAAKCRAHLAYIPSGAPASVLAATKHMRLDRSLKLWEPARRASVALLTNRHDTGASAEGVESVAFVWSVDTSKLWEALLLLALKDETPPGGVEVDAREGNAGNNSDSWCCPPPWKELGNDKQPDLLVAVGSDQRWVIDAKYKDVEKPVAADQYQLFAYSYLARINGAPPTHAAIAFPKRPDVEKPIKGTYARFSSDPSNDPSRKFVLSLVHVPFPPQDAALSDDAWRKALGAMRRTWREVFFPPKQPSETSATESVARAQIE